MALMHRQSHEPSLFYLRESVTVRDASGPPAAVDVSPHTTITTTAAEGMTTSTATSPLCQVLAPNKIVISRNAFIVTITTCAILACMVLLTLALLLWRKCLSRRQAKAAKAWGRQSRLGQRISMMRKEIDDDFRRQYSGCLVNSHENPEMGSDSPVELGFPEQKVWEAPAAPPKVAFAVELEGWKRKSKGVHHYRNKRKSKVGSLFFDHGVGLWVPK